MGNVFSLCGGRWAYIEHVPAAGGSQPCPQVEAERPKGLNITVSSWQRYEATTLHQTPLKKAVILPLKTKVWLAFVLPRCCQQCFFSECLFVKRGAGLPKGAGLWKGAGVSEGEWGWGWDIAMREKLHHCQYYYRMDVCMEWGRGFD